MEVPLNMRKLHVILQYAMAAFCLLTPDAQASDTICNDYLILESEQPRAARVASAAGPRLYFHRSYDPCPGGPDCKATEYLVPKDKVMVHDDGGPWLCAYHRGIKTDTFGWLPRASLVIDTHPPRPTKQDWMGRWEFGYNTLLFEDRPEQALFFKGAAFTRPWFLSSQKADLVPVGDKVEFINGTCKITMRWVSGMILATNTQDCVGPSNSFYGFYVRVALTTDPHAAKSVMGGW